MRLAAVALGGLGALTGLATAWFAAGSGDVAPRLVILAVASCVLALFGAQVVARRRGRHGAVLLAEALVGLGFGLGEYAIIPGTILLLGAVLAWMAG